jgi:FdhE protein
MSKVGAPLRDPTQIGEVASPPFVRLPEPLTLFVGRARRLHALAEGHSLAPYLRFVAGLADCQHRAQLDLLEPEMPDGEARERARAFGMPPLDRNRVVVEPAVKATLDRLFSRAAAMEMPQTARRALECVAGKDASGRGAMVRAVLADAIPVESLAEHVYVAAALQVHFARLAARLDPARLVPVGDGACPACGGPPAASLLVGWPGAHGARFCACWLCGTMWNAVRIKCVLCGSTEGVAYREVEGGPGRVKAETCEKCRGYVKILNQQKEPDADPIADDVASLALDLLVRDAGFRRGAVNPFLIGY